MQRPTLYETDDAGREFLTPAFEDLINNELYERGFSPEHPNYDRMFAEVEQELAAKIQDDFDDANGQRAIDRYLDGEL